MGRNKREVKVTLDTIWEVPDDVWERLEPILNDACPPARTGRPRSDLRKVFNGIIFVMRTGCQWNRLPKCFGDDSTVHRWFQKWVRQDVFEAMMAILINECDELEGVEWEWQSADCAMGKTRMGGEKRGPTRPIAANPEPRRASSWTVTAAR